MTDDDSRFRLMYVVLLTLLALTMLTGCFKSNTRSKTTYQGMYDGKPVILEAATTSETDSGVDVAKAINLAVGAATGDLKKVIESMKPDEPEEDNTDKYLKDGGLILLILSQYMRAQEHKKDAQEGWDRAMRNQQPPTDRA